MWDKRTAVGWIADDGLVVGPSAVRNDRNLRARVVDQADILAAIGQSVADASVVGIDRDRESRRVAAAEEDDVRAGFNNGVSGELEVGVRRRAVAQAPAAYIDGC